MWVQLVASFTTIRTFVRPVFMRPTPWIVLLLGLSSQSAFAEDETEVSSDLLFYSDSDHVNVVSPQVGVRHALDEDGGEVSARVTLDAITAASVDVISNATYRFSELRTEANLAVSKSVGEALPSLSYRVSDEPDYTSHGITLGSTYEMAGGDSTVFASFSHTRDSIGRVGTPSNVFEESLRSNAGEIGVTQVIDTKTLVRLAYSMTAQFGYMEKPYRSVPIFAESDLTLLSDGGTSLGLRNFDNFRLPAKPSEEVPGRRYRHAAALRGLRYLDAIDASVRVDYRLYGDSWGIWSHTLEGAVAKSLGENWLLSAWSRLYYQNGADFWRRTYGVNDRGSIPSLRTMDKSLSPYWQNMTGARGEYSGKRIDYYLQLEFMYSHFLDHLLIESRNALVGQGGIRWHF